MPFKVDGNLAGNEVLASMIVGHLKVTFRRCIRRDLKKVTWV